MPAPHADEAFFFHHPPPARTTSGNANATASSWGPYTGAGDFGGNMAIVLAALLCTVLLALSLGAAIRLLLNRLRSPSEETEKQQPPPSQQQQRSVPAMLYSAAGTRLAGAASECAICLTEFEEGDAVRVLPACNHGFHVRCVERWLAARGSCPTCRALCGVEAGHGRKGDPVEVVVQGI